MLPSSLHAEPPADHQAVLGCLKERCLASADVNVQARVLQQLQVASQHLHALASALLLQQQLTGLDARTPEAKQQAALAAGFAPDDLDQQAHDDEPDDRAPLTPEAERLLQAAFTLADVLDASQVSGLAFLARCSEQQLRNHFSRLRTSVRSAVQRAQKRAHGSTSGAAKPGTDAAIIPASNNAPPSYPPPPPSSAHLLPPYHDQQQQAGAGAPQPLQGLALALQQQQEAALQRTHLLLDPAGLITMSSAGSFVAVMQQTTSVTARRRQLAALRATGVSTLTRLCTSKFLDILQAWLQEGLAEQQLSFVRQLLHTMQHVPINTALLHSSPLLHTVRDLAKRGPVAASAGQVMRKWGQQQDQATWDGVSPLLLGAQPVGGAAAAKAGGARQQGEGGLLGMRPLGGQSLGAQRSLSAAVKRKVQEMKAGGAGQPPAAAGGGGGGGGGGAPRAPSSLTQQQQQQQQQPSLQRQASATGGSAAGTGAATAVGGRGGSTAAAAAAAGFKRPSKVARTLAGGAHASATAQRAALVQRQLAGAAAGSSGAATTSAVAVPAGGAGGAGSADPVRVTKPADLTPGQRLYRMQVKPVDQQLLQRMTAPGSAATASQLAQGLMAYNRALQLWLAARCRRVGLEARAAAQLSLGRQQQRQAAVGFSIGAASAGSEGAGAGVAAGALGGPTESWCEPPAVVWSAELDVQVAAGQESQDAGNHQLAAATASSAYGVLSAEEVSPREAPEDDGSNEGFLDAGDTPSAAHPGSSGGDGAAARVAAAVPWHPVEGQAAAAVACRVWSAGVRVPDCYQLPLPSVQDMQRYEAEQQAAKAKAAQGAGVPGAPAPGQLVHPQYHTVQQYGMPVQTMHQQQQPAGMVMHMVPGQVVQPGGYAVPQHQPMQQVVQVVYPPGYVAAPTGYMSYVTQYPPGYQ